MEMEIDLQKVVLDVLSEYIDRPVLLCRNTRCPNFSGNTKGSFGCNLKEIHLNKDGECSFFKSISVFDAQDCSDKRA